MFKLSTHRKCVCIQFELVLTVVTWNIFEAKKKVDLRIFEAALPRRNCSIKRFFFCLSKIASKKFLKITSLLWRWSSWLSTHVEYFMLKVKIFKDWNAKSMSRIRCVLSHWRFYFIIESWRYSVCVCVDVKSWYVWRRILDNRERISPDPNNFWFVATNKV